MHALEFKRTDRVAAELRRHMGQLVHAAVRDQALPSCNVSDVEVSSKLDWATIWIMALLPGYPDELIRLLNAMRSEFRHALSRRVRLRRVPALRFRYDDSVDRGERIEAMLGASKASLIVDEGDT